MRFFDTRKFIDRLKWFLTFVLLFVVYYVLIEHLRAGSFDSGLVVPLIFVGIAAAIFIIILNSFIEHICMPGIREIASSGSEFYRFFNLAIVIFVFIIAIFLIWIGQSQIENMLLGKDISFSPLSIILDFVLSLFTIYIGYKNIII
ncbi:MAG: hypothetical protein QW112_00780 [Candidatus Micrarchaeia archaeon]